MRDDGVRGCVQLPLLDIQIQLDSKSFPLTSLSFTNSNLAAVLLVPPHHMRSFLPRHLCTSERQRRGCRRGDSGPDASGKRYTGQNGEKARARGLPVARGNKWSGWEPGPLCRGAESTRGRPAQRLTKPTSIDRMKIEPTKRRATVERTGTWPRTRTHAKTQQEVEANTKHNSYASLIYKKKHEQTLQDNLFTGIVRKEILQVPIIFSI